MVALIILLHARLLIFIYNEGFLRGEMSSEATAKEVLYKPVDIERDTPRKRWGSIVLECVMRSYQAAKRLAGALSELHIS